MSEILRETNIDTIVKLQALDIKDQIKKRLNDAFFSLSMERKLIEDVEKSTDIEGLKIVAKSLNNERHGNLWGFAVMKIEARIKELEKLNS